jgi:hypothetical protein
VKFWETIFHFSNYSKITASEDNKLFIKLGNGKCAYSDALILKKFNLKLKKKIDSFIRSGQYFPLLSYKQLLLICKKKFA